MRRHFIRKSETTKFICTPKTQDIQSKKYSGHNSLTAAEVAVINYLWYSRKRSAARLRIAWILFSPQKRVTRANPEGKLRKGKIDAVIYALSDLCLVEKVVVKPRIRFGVIFTWFIIPKRIYRREMVTKWRLNHFFLPHEPAAKGLAWLQNPRAHQTNINEEPVVIMERDLAQELAVHFQTSRW